MEFRFLLSLFLWLICGSTAVIFFFVWIFGLIKKKPRKTPFILFVLSISFPFFVALLFEVDNAITVWRFEGIYTGVDSLNNIVVVEIGNERNFIIDIENCNEVLIEGNWSYYASEDDFIFYPSSKIRLNILNISREYDGSIELKCDYKSDCCNLSEVILKKE
tara:strand:+ start:115 stop:600 length:486 start_codon:yes stop_codon:yes gene_type:complete